MDFTGLLILGALYALLHLIGRWQQKKNQEGERHQAPRAGPPGRFPPVPHEPGSLDATQQEGSRLEMILRHLERALDEGSAEQPITLSPPPTEAGRSTSWTIPSQPEQEEIEERESLEFEPEIVSLETEVRRQPRLRVDQDHDAEQIEVRRISAAAARDKATTKADHREFDQRIHQEPADKTAVGYTARQLRDAVVWREILGPPVSLRNENSELSS
jgi:hypothetical protein